MYLKKINPNKTRIYRPLLRIYIGFTKKKKKTSLLSGSHKIAFLKTFCNEKSFQMSLISQIYFSKKQLSYQQQ